VSLDTWVGMDVVKSLDLQRYFVAEFTILAKVEFLA